MDAVFLTPLLFQESAPIEVRVALIVAGGTALAGIMAFINTLWSNRQTNAQKETGDYYQNTFLELRQDKIDLTKEIEGLEQEKRNFEAQLQKQKIEHREEKRILVKERDAYAVYAAKLRQVARKYAPKNYELPELDMNGTSTPQSQKVE